MAVTPKDGQGVGADGLDLVDAQLRVYGRAQQMFVGRSAHIIMPALAFGAGADGAQPGKGVAAFLAVIPGDDQFAFVTVSGDVCWFDFVHKVSQIVE